MKINCADNLEQFMADFKVIIRQFDMKKSPALPTCITHWTFINKGLSLAYPKYKHLHSIRLQKPSTKS